MRHEDRIPAWHAEPIREVLARLDTEAGGLSDDEAARRLRAGADPPPGERAQRAQRPAPVARGTNRWALGAVALSLALQMLTTVEPLARILRVVPLRPGEWAAVIVLAVTPAVVGQGLKKMWSGVRRH
jgi:hypothetical protein